MGESLGLRDGNRTILPLPALFQTNSVLLPIGLEAGAWLPPPIGMDQGCTPGVEAETGLFHMTFILAALALGFLAAMAVLVDGES